MDARKALSSLFFAALLAQSGASRAQGQDAAPTKAKRDPCDFTAYNNAVWWGTRTSMTMKEIAAYVAPILWFSPDEPNLGGAEGAAISIPEALPFEQTAGKPILYFQVDDILSDGRGVERDTLNPANARIDLRHVTVMKISFFAYFASEEGLGSHKHDIETVEFRVVILPSNGKIMREDLGIACDEPGYVIAVTRVTGKAHGIVWFWNRLATDAETRFPMHVLVEEGKHALCPDKNGDGYFTPSYDVNRFVNDAWGIRDVIRSGGLVTSRYEGWMTKVRRPQDQVLPPLPQDSPRRSAFLQKIGDASGHATYELRPFPPIDSPGADEGIREFMKGKNVAGWPREHQGRTFSELRSFVTEGAVVKTLGVNFYYDGDAGISFAFPFFIVKNLSDPISNGFITHRVYLKGRNTDVGWMAQYTPSASRWFDTYLAAGAEWTHQETPTGKETNADFVFETGMKLRVNIGHAPLGPLKKLTDFWGVRAGVKNYGFTDIDRLTYVFEFGAGAW